ncbi:MAG: hypothetical protein IKM63_05455 [Firmicutes bacterium]|nr:hypothetical protein [Bacillota bacterium]
MLTVALVITMAPINTGYTYAETGTALATESPEILVSGTGLIGEGTYSKANVGLEKAYTIAEIKAMTAENGTNVLYSAKETQYPFNESLYRASGVYVSDLLGESVDLTAKKVSFLPSDNLAYTSIFDPNVEYKNEGAYTTSGLNHERYVFPNLLNGSENGKTAIEPMLAWAYKDSDKDDPETAKERDFIRLIIGQVSSEDMNKNLYTKNVQKVVVGEQLTETALTANGTEYTRGEVLLMPRATKEYTYTKTSSDGSTTQATKYAKGVPLAELLDGVAEDSVINFEAVDGYGVAATGKTLKELIDGNAMLAYEDGEGSTALTSIYNTDKNDKSKYGFFTLYVDGISPGKMVNKIIVTSASGNDYTKSSYKHITNGGKSGKTPYNIDAITGATLTIEGPGVKESTPISVGELETKNNGIYRGVYTDIRNGKATKRTYEGVDLYYILTQMNKDGVEMTNEAQKIVIKNRVRQDVAAFTKEQVQMASEDGHPILVAYGTAFEDGSDPKPFVFDGKNGGDDELGNYDGCLKLVYDKSSISGDLNADYTKFANMMYIYVEEDKAPGYKHVGEKYSDPNKLNYVITVTGDKIGREVNYTLQELEDMVEYDADGKPVADGIGFRQEYSLTNTSYWYVNEYEGVKLWDLLLKSGLDKSLANEKDTFVKYKTTDNYGSVDSFSLYQLANPKESFGFYEKNAEDNPPKPGEEPYVSTDEADKKNLDQVYPVLLAYGVNQYPYVINTTEEGYLSGLKNDGGPVRVISGKVDYYHNNGSNQGKYIEKIIVGDDTYHYSTHKYHGGQEFSKIYNELAATTNLSVKVLNEGVSELDKQEINLGKIEELAYKDGSDAKTIKKHYKIVKGDKVLNDLFEGLDLAYFLTEVVGLEGEKGTVNFANEDGDEIAVSLEDILKFEDGYNDYTGVEGLTPVLAYAKNGAPMVATSDSEGYESSVKLDGANKTPVKNSDGPLCLVFPMCDNAEISGKMIKNLSSITINLSPDNYAHTASTYDSYRNNELRIYGDGLATGEKTFTLGALEKKQAYAVTADYSFLNNKGTETKLRYRGIDLGKFLNSNAVGLKATAATIKVYPDNGDPIEFTRSEVEGKYINSMGDSDLKMILAYGSASVENTDIEDGKPLVEGEESDGYIDAYENDGGPLKLIVGQKDANDKNKSMCVKNVVAIEVVAGEMDSWNHSTADVYKKLLDYKVTLKVEDADNNIVETKEYTLEELEAMTSIITREEINGSSLGTYEGLNLWALVLQEFKGIVDGSNMTDIICTSDDGKKAQSLMAAVHSKDQIMHGVPDGSNRPIMLAYAVNETPLVGSKNTEDGFISAKGNSGGPLRLMVHNSSGACNKSINEIVVKISGTAATKFDKVEADKDIPDAGIRSVSKDKNGTLWVGTIGGALYKSEDADGFTVLNTESTPALVADGASAVAADADGGIWISQNANSYDRPEEQKGVIYMKDGKITQYTAEDAEKTIPNNYIQDIRIDGDGNVWFASFGGLTKYDPKANTWKTWTKADGFPAAAVTRIEFDANGGMWLGFYPDGNGTASDGFVGGFAYMSKDGKITSYQQIAELDEASMLSKLADVWVRDIAVDKDGAAWIVASGAYSYIENVGGTVWYVAPGKEPVKYTGDQLFGEALNGADNAELRMVAAASDGLYFGTSADGVFYVKDAAVTEGKLTITEEYSKENGSWDASLMNNVYSIDIIGDTLYVGSTGGLAWIEVASGEVTPEDPVEPEEPADGKEVVGGETVETATLSVTGSALDKNGYFSIRSLKNTEGIERRTEDYFWVNSKGNTGTETEEGAYIEDILNVLGLNVPDAKITFYSSDVGYEYSTSVSAITKTDLYGLKPMLAWKENGDTIDLKLVIGQYSSNDINKSNWLKKVARVEVEPFTPMELAENKIAALDSLVITKATLDESKAVVEEARAAYEALTEEEKANVSEETVNVLLKSELAVAKVEKNKLEEELNEVISVTQKSVGAVKVKCKWVNKNRIDIGYSWNAVKNADEYKVVLYRNGKALKAKTVKKNNVKFSYYKRGYKYTAKVTPVVKYDGNSYTGKTISKNFTTQHGIATISVKKNGSYFRIKSADRNSTGYQIYISKSKKFSKGVKKVKIKTNDKALNKKLKASKHLKYGRNYIKVRAYTTYNGQTVYGKWSSVKKIYR